MEKKRTRFWVLLAQGNVAYDVLILNITFLSQLGVHLKFMGRCVHLAEECTYAV